MRAELDEEADAPMLESEKTGGRLPRDGTATQTEITTALEGLTSPQLLRLNSYARYRMRALGPRAMGRTHEDLLSEAYTSTLSGVRRWNKDAVDLLGHLCGVMRSVSSHWAELKAASSESLDDWDDDHGSRIDVAPGGMPDAERELMARQQVERILTYFDGDHLVLQVIEAFRKGMKGPEAQAELGINQKEFETAVKRLRRGVERLSRLEAMGDDYV